MMRGAYERARAKREAAESLPRRERKRKLPEARSWESLQRNAVERAGREARAAELPGEQARNAHALARQALAERGDHELLALRLKPPTYITKELGERPSDPSQAKAWDHGAQAVESYRREHGVTDTKSALGKRPPTLEQGRVAHDAAQRRLLEAQRRLNLQQQLKRTTERGIGIERGFGISM
jgi:hypothetical protein